MAWGMRNIFVLRARKSSMGQYGCSNSDQTRDWGTTLFQIPLLVVFGPCVQYLQMAAMYAREPDWHTPLAASLLNPSCSVAYIRPSVGLGVMPSRAEYVLF